MSLEKGTITGSMDTMLRETRARFLLVRRKDWILNVTIVTLRIVAT
jgi:hypothetical protein